MDDWVESPAGSHHRSFWDSRGLPQRDRLPTYAEEVERSLFSSTMMPFDDKTFAARMAVVRFGTARAVRFSASPHHVQRLRREVNRTCEDIVVAGIHLSDGVRVRANDQELVRSKGDIVALQSDSRFCLETRPDHPFQMLSLLFDGASIDKIAGPSRRQPLKLLRCGQSTATLRACIGLFGRRFQGRAPHDELQAIFRACEALLAAVFVEDRDFLPSASHGTPAADGIVIAMKDFCDARLPDPDLGVGDVAEAFGLSTRHVQSLFARQGTGVSQYILDRRLEGVHRSLSDPDIGRQAIGHVARQWGFASRATFNRTFRRRYNLTPSEMTRSRPG